MGLMRPKSMYDAVYVVWIFRDWASGTEGALGTKRGAFR
jgi:hypothetical protein